MADALRIAEPAGFQRGRTSSFALLVGAALASVVLVVASHELEWWAKACLILGATACCALLSRRDLELAPVVFTIAAAALVAVVVAPVGSHDVWSYVMYGRMLGVHGVNPYLHTPNQFPHDPFFHLVNWRTTPSMYGPLFNDFSALGALVAGRSMLVARLWHQVAAAGALTGVLTIVWRRTRDPRALVWLGLHPVIVVSVVNGGHNDLMVGLCFVAAAIALRDGHDSRAGAMVGLAALIKATAALGLIGALVWAWSKRGSPAGRRVVGAAVAIGALGALPFGLASATVFGNHANLLSGSSIWRLGRDALNTTAIHVPDWRFIAGIGVLALVVLAARWLRADRDPATCIGGSVAAYQAAGPYVLPWYAAWSLPTLALHRDTPISRWAWWCASFFFVVYLLPNGNTLGARNLEYLVVVIVFPIGVLWRFVVAARARERGASHNQEVIASGTV